MKPNCEFESWIETGFWSADCGSSTTTATGTNVNIFLQLDKASLAQYAQE